VVEIEFELCYGGSQTKNLENGMFKC